ncbi:MAG: recombinase family protein [Clostridiales bacterium]|nr:recombinase family protein [Clostridiales bacterium]
MPIAACYVRVSTENQRENYSIAEQTARLKAFCQAKDITIGNFFTDSGYSGGNVHRPALQKMLSSLKDFDTVIVYKLDRLSRSQKDTLRLSEDYVLAQNINFISVCENFDTSTPFGRATIGLLSIFAQLEKDQITERFTMGRIGRAKNGYYHGGPHAPTGYDYVDGRLVINVYEAMQIQELF